MTILIVDIGSMVHTDWAAGGDRAATLGNSRVTAFAEAFGITTVYGALDSHCQWRRNLLPTYKAERPARDPLLDVQINEFCRNFPGRLMRADDAEADDVIATLVEQHPDEKIVIMSRDKDMRQLLVDGRVLILRRYNLSEGLNPRRIAEWYSAADLAKPSAQKGWGIKPEQAVDFQAVCGDKTDGVPGAEGVGEKTIGPLLAEFGTIEGVLEGATLTERRRAALEAILPKLEAVRSVLTLQRDCVVVEAVQETHVWKLRLGKTSHGRFFLECNCGRCDNRFYGYLNHDDANLMARVSQIEAEVRRNGFYDPCALKGDKDPVEDVS